MRKINLLTFALVALVTLTSMRQDRVITVFMVGDSTMANKDISGDKQERGWGMALQCYFDDGILIDNHAVNGRSSKSFIDEGRWQKVLEKIRPGDYVVIQFGHNDEKPASNRHTDPGTTFDANLRRMVKESRERGAKPILMNAVVRRNFLVQAPVNNDDEALRNTVAANLDKPRTDQQQEGDVLIDTHGAYLISPRNVAIETGTPFIDANCITHKLEQGLGREASKRLHMIFKNGEHPSMPEGRNDNTHYSVYGAHVVAKLLAEAMADEVPELRQHLIEKDVVSVAKNGIGDFLDVQIAVDAQPDGQRTIIQLFEGEWKRPVLGKKKIKFVMRQGASWKK